LSISKEIFKHEYEFKKGIKERDKEGLILCDVPLMSHMPLDQEASFVY